MKQTMRKRIMPWLLVLALIFPVTYVSATEGDNQNLGQEQTQDSSNEESFSEGQETKNETQGIEEVEEGSENEEDAVEDPEEETAKDIITEEEDLMFLFSLTATLLDGEAETSIEAMSNSAVTVVNNTAGGLEDAIGNVLGANGSAGDIEKLIITGTMNADDFAYLSKNLSDKITEIDISGTDLTTLPSYAFSNSSDWGADGKYDNLSKVILPAELLYIGQAAFIECTNLALTELPGKVIWIDAIAFYNCTNLELTELPDGVTNIGLNAFYNCTNLALTKLPSKLTKIEPLAFEGCTSLPKIIKADFESIPTMVFSPFTNSTLEAMIVPDALLAPEFQKEIDGILFINHSGDYDGDGVSNINEYNAKTDPLDVDDYEVIPSFTDIAVKSQPKLVYTEGAALELNDLVVTLIYDDASTEDVAFADFTSKSITVSPDHGTTLTIADHNGIPVTITCEEKTTTTGNLEVVGSYNHDPIKRPDPNTSINLEEELEVSFQGDFLNFIEIHLNGNKLDTETSADGTFLYIKWPGKEGAYCGEIHSGSVVITLYDEFVKTLPDGTYLLKVFFNDNGTVNSGELDFLVKREDNGGNDSASEPEPETIVPVSSIKAPKTGDDGVHPIGWVFLFAVAAGLAAGAGIFLKKRE